MRKTQYQCHPEIQELRAQTVFWKKLLQGLWCLWILMCGELFCLVSEQMDVLPEPQPSLPYHEPIRSVPLKRTHFLRAPPQLL